MECSLVPLPRSTDLSLNVEVRDIGTALRAAEELHSRQAKRRTRGEALRDLRAAVVVWFGFGFWKFNTMKKYTCTVGE